MTISRVGIDTIQIEINGLHEIKPNNRMILSDKTTYTGKGNTRLVLRGVNGLSSVNVILEHIQELEEVLGIKVEIVRVDIAADSKQYLKHNINLARLFLECLSIVRRNDNGNIFKTIMGIEKYGNIKLSSGRIETTFYNRSDKNGTDNTRLENRAKDIRRQQANKKILETEIEKYIQEIKGLELLVEKVEHKYIQELANLYYQTINKKYRTFTEFIAFADSQGYIMTSNILKGLMAEVGIKQSSNTFAKNFRRLRVNTLNFGSKNELKKFLKDLEKKLKIALKN
ncbi:MAG: hypothetical protein RR523_13255 [Cetobacterium sp.]|uniref:hypothetical protein n=1 Tax=unclassified Cetobacterium TaxID=2630983 RepID=UPI00163C29F8|nr:hypothetical protein [Cetobacterium sp. 8H]MBC2849848.1 hypothetical protein [Cetobacterium sp. 8H]MBC2849865.1 hypothetical protein [Cetobacterium sp. 8H]